mmetsp:Transcript_14436/g.23685  ORF Transcript_14436/g.23685 Transcript_14436/m.23685 type:complete len:114 (-) Transcript_14436:1975-2316(-)
MRPRPSTQERTLLRLRIRHACQQLPESQEKGGIHPSLLIVLIVFIRRDQQDRWLSGGRVRQRKFDRSMDKALLPIGAISFATERFRTGNPLAMQSGQENLRKRQATNSYCKGL